MATTEDSFNGMSEHCSRCGRDTLHEVTVQIRTESRKAENSQFSREPYRVAECQRCGNLETTRMNNA